MNAGEMKALGVSFVKKGAPALPTVLLVREVKAYELEFASLKFEENIDLPAADRVALELVRALGRATPADVDSYLGLGATVSENLFRRLFEGEYLQPPSALKAVATGWGEKLRGFFRRLFRIPPPPPPPPPGSIPRKVYASEAATTPICSISSKGVRTLTRGTVPQLRMRPARLLFLHDPLLYLDTVDETRARYAQHRRVRPLEADRVPQRFTRIDTILGKPAVERASQCGIENTIEGFSGTLMGVEEGTQWEVREESARADNQNALLILAAFPASDRDLHWVAFVRWRDQLRQCATLDPLTLLDPSLRTLKGVLGAIDAAALGFPLPEKARSDGAFDIQCDSASLGRFLGEADRPDDTFLAAQISGWQYAGLRVCARPADRAAETAAFYEFLSRRDAELRSNFDATCEAVATMLRDHWQVAQDFPSPEEAARHLWTTPKLRAAVCMRRLQTDMVAPYMTQEVSA